MQTTYRLHSREIDYNFFEAFKKLFQNKEVKITIEEVIETKELPVNQVDLYKSMEKQRDKLKGIKISKNLNINDLVDEMYSQGNI